MAAISHTFIFGQGPNGQYLMIFSKEFACKNKVFITDSFCMKDCSGRYVFRYKTITYNNIFNKELILCKH